VIAGAGSVVAIPGGREHTIRNESPTEALAYVVFAPGSEIERFMRAADALAPRGTADPLSAAPRAIGFEKRLAPSSPPADP
jgi:hypothetical protein